MKSTLAELFTRLMNFMIQKECAGNFLLILAEKKFTRFNPIDIKPCDKSINMYLMFHLMTFLYVVGLRFL